MRKIKEWTLRVSRQRKKFIRKLLKRNTGVSTMRYWRLWIIRGLMIHWFYSIFVNGDFTPSWQLVSLIGGFFGFTVWQENKEGQLQLKIDENRDYEQDGL